MEISLDLVSIHAMGVITSMRLSVDALMCPVADQNLEREVMEDFQPFPRPTTPLTSRLGVANLVREVKVPPREAPRREVHPKEVHPKEVHPKEAPPALVAPRE